LVVTSPQLLAPDALDATRHCHRMNDAATLAGRLAHDFDNLLTGVLGFAELALAQVPDGTPTHQYLTELSSVARRGMAMTQQMHDLSRCGRCAPEPTSLPLIWDLEAAAVAAKSGGQATIAADFADSLPPVRVAPEPLGLVLRNVLANAVEALAGPGEVRAAVRFVTLPESATDYRPRPLAPGGYVELTVTDNGPGIRPDVLAQLTTTPFVTTKVRHRGLGVAIICRVLDAHGGGVRFDAAHPRGTRVTLMLPAAPAAHAVSPPSGRTATPSASR
jgi:signal transduction histidine kinase